MRIGYKLCSEERTAPQLVDDARRAEAVGFSFAAISDHFHPWIEAQGQSPFVWSVLGAVADATSTLEVGTAVTCPTIRMHPAIVAQAAATVATLAEGRFFLGVGTGENLNEHVVARGWPNVEKRQRMLREAVDVVRALWEGDDVSIEGDFHVVDHARLYSLPPSPPPVYVAASGPASATLAGEVGDGLIATSPEAELVDRFVGSGGRGPRLAEILVCVGDDADAAMRTVLEGGRSPRSQDRSPRSFPSRSTSRRRRAPCGRTTSRTRSRSAPTPVTTSPRSVATLRPGSTT